MSKSKRSLAAEVRAIERERNAPTPERIAREERERQIRRCWWTPPFGHVWAPAVLKDFHGTKYWHRVDRCVNCGWEPSYWAERDNSEERKWAVRYVFPSAVLAALLGLLVVGPLEKPVHGAVDTLVLIVGALLLLYAFLALLAGAFLCSGPSGDGF